MKNYKKKKGIFKMGKMGCEYCGRINGHETGCPNFVPPKTNFNCCYCKEGIYDGEEFLCNCEGQYIHRDCISGIDFVINWLGYEVKEMENSNCFD